MDLLTSLTDKSLVFVEEAAGEANFQRLETIRQYALEKFLETGEVEAVRDRHLDFFVALAEQAEPELTGPAQQMWTARLEREQENIRAALRWAEARDPLAGVRIVSALRWFWDAHEHYVDAFRVTGWHGLWNARKSGCRPASVPVRSACWRSSVSRATI
ncbi:MAG: hypothetical protein M9927_20980 [Anaerolineae bacterium]|nr:hypothetical protein [Anaerolineae bacterium]